MSSNEFGDKKDPATGLMVAVDSIYDLVRPKNPFPQTYWSQVQYTQTMALMSVYLRTQGLLPQTISGEVEAGEYFCDLLLQQPVIRSTAEYVEVSFAARAIFLACAQEDSDIAEIGEVPQAYDPYGYIQSRALLDISEAVIHVNPTLAKEALQKVKYIPLGAAHFVSDVARIEASGGDFPEAMNLTHTLISGGHFTEASNLLVEISAAITENSEYLSAYGSQLIGLLNFLEVWVGPKKQEDQAGEKQEVYDNMYDKVTNAWANLFMTIDTHMKEEHFGADGEFYNSDHLQSFLRSFLTYAQKDQGMSVLLLVLAPGLGLLSEALATARKKGPLPFRTKEDVAALLQNPVSLLRKLEEINPLLVGREKELEALIEKAQVLQGKV